METETTLSPIGSYAPDFELPGVDGAVHHLARYLETYRAVGVIFMSDRCPSVIASLDRLKQIQAEFSSQRFTLIGINANEANLHPEESFENMKVFASEYKLNFPYLRDPTQDVACSFNAETTPQAFLLDRRSAIVYTGAIDDNPQNPEAVQVPYLRNAIASLLSGLAIATNHTQSIGCSLIKWRQ